VTRFNVSPKLANSGVPEHLRMVPDALVALRDTGRAVFKFVAADEDDLDEIGRIVDRLGLAPVWVMPEGTTAAAVLEGARPSPTRCWPGLAPHHPAARPAVGRRAGPLSRDGQW
jgi:hypothetical protein